MAGIADDMRDQIASSHRQTQYLARQDLDRRRDEAHQRQSRTLPAANQGNYHPGYTAVAVAAAVVAPKIMKSTEERHQQVQSNVQRMQQLDEKRAAKKAKRGPRRGVGKFLLGE